MKDIDFEELDRAVNSLIASGSNTIGNINPVTNDVKPSLSKTPINSHFASSLNSSPVSSVKAVTPIDKPVQAEQLQQIIAEAEPIVSAEPAFVAKPEIAELSLLSTEYVEPQTQLPVPNQVPIEAPELVEPPVFIQSAPILPPIPAPAVPKEAVIIAPLKPTIQTVLAPVAPVAPVAPEITPIVSPVTKPLPTIPIPVKPSHSISPLVSRRSGGRFMDVVPPSTDMRTVLSAPDRVSRLGSDLDLSEPVSQITVSQNIEPKPVLEPKPVIEEPTKDSWPDPIEFNNTAELNKTAAPNIVVFNPEDEDEDDDINRINDDIDKTLNQMPEVQESPFLTGAKVEKRPLNAFMAESLNTALSGVVEDTVPKATDVEVVIEKTTGDGQNDNNSGQNDMDAPLPAELQGDLLSIESGNAVSDPDPAPEPAFVPISTPVQAPVQVAQQPPIASQPPIQTSAVNTVANRVNPATDGPTSISQQYQERPNTGDQNSGSIYDTDSYHKAIVKPAKKVASWLWVVWILLLLVVGSGVGAAIYFFVLPLL